MLFKHLVESIEAPGNLNLWNSPSQSDELSKVRGTGQTLTILTRGRAGVEQVTDSDF